MRIGIYDYFYCLSLSWELAISFSVYDITIDFDRRTNRFFLLLVTNSPKNKLCIENVEKIRKKFKNQSIEM